jgi:hypothetical protein
MELPTIIVRGARFASSAGILARCSGGVLTAGNETGRATRRAPEQRNSVAADVILRAKTLSPGAALSPALRKAYGFPARRQGLFFLFFAPRKG